MSRRLAILIPCAIAAFLCFFFLPGTKLDRAAFYLTARSFANPPLFISGQGSHQHPYAVSMLKSTPEKTPPTLPTIISIGDDPDNYFQSSPPSPVDFAIILSNLKRLGREEVAIGFPMAWQETDAISLAALDLQLDSIPALTTSAPLIRAPVPAAMPAAFRRAAVPLSQVQGNSSQLAKVNSVAIPDVIFGNNSALAGFTDLESEPPTKTPYLIARWDDSIVLSFHLVTAMRHFQVSPADLEIHPGKYLSLGKNGPSFPLDKHGRLTFAPASLPDTNAIPAPYLIDAKDDFLAENSALPLILRNDISNRDELSRAYAQNLASTIAALTSPAATTPARIFPRPPTNVEITLLCSLLVLLTALSLHPLAENKILPFLVPAVIAIVHFSLIPATNTWLPTLPSAAAVLSYIALSTIIPVSRKTSQAAVSTPVLIQPRTPLPIERIETPAPVVSEELTSKPPAKKTAKKAIKAAKKSARKTRKKTTRKTAKKAAAKKSSSRKKST